MYHKRRTERRLTGSASRAASHVSHVEVRIRTRINYTYGISHTDDQTTKQNGGGGGGRVTRPYARDGPMLSDLGRLSRDKPSRVEICVEEERGGWGFRVGVSCRFQEVSKNKHPSLSLCSSSSTLSLFRDCFEIASR